MPIPKEVLAVPRPTNTIVKTTRNPNVFNVIKRTSKRVPGKKNPIPVECGTIGKIVDKVYIPLPEKPKHEVDIKTYGDFALCDIVGKSIYRDLLNYYDPSDAAKIYCIALLRVITPELTNEDIQYEYKTSYISELYPNVALSPNTISTFLEKIGMHYSIIEKFMNDRIKTYSRHATVIDGMLKNNSSETNSYSEYSRKGRTKGVEDISLLYAYDLVLKEPIACSAYPGNMLDLTSFKSFINDYPIKKGFIIMDKGFNDSKSKTIIKKLKTNYLIPIKTSAKVISDNNLDKEYSEYFKCEEDVISCKKVKINDVYYYAYKSTEMKGDQEKGYINRSFEKGKLNDKEYSSKESKFGLIVFESNADLKLEDVYTAYKKRWEIEVLFNNYKNIVNRQEVNVHGDYRLLATEFINFLSSIISMRIKNKLVETKLNEKYTQRQVLRLLGKFSKKRSTKVDDKWTSCARLEYVVALCKQLKIV